MTDSIHSGDWTDYRIAQAVSTLSFEDLPGKPVLDNPDTSPN
jgi:hypothetical protein